MFFDKPWEIGILHARIPFTQVPHSAQRVTGFIHLLVRFFIILEDQLTVIRSRLAVRLALRKLGTCEFFLRSIYAIMRAKGIIMLLRTAILFRLRWNI